MYEDIIKFIQIKIEILYVIREINNNKTIKNLVKTNFNQSFTPVFCLCMKYNIVCGNVFVIIQYI